MVTMKCQLEPCLIIHLIAVGTWPEANSTSVKIYGQLGPKFVLLCTKQVSVNYPIVQTCILVTHTQLSQVPVHFVYCFLILLRTAFRGVHMLDKYKF